MMSYEQSKTTYNKVNMNCNWLRVGR